ncbi:hypothetical protein [Pseudoalteromonas sp. T1lg75]|uniref:hypothetical protein n=1 Tax=Pseudoalteromonas sp. T1lg75 TaxID=2077102 RepID=UPI000CF72991|nr:hypothetical protein [Pseudoalteromonas sp. T1lg75]
MTEANTSAFTRIHEHVLEFDSENFRKRKDKICIATNDEAKRVLKYAEIKDSCSIYNRYYYTELAIDDRRLVAIKGVDEIVIDKNELDKYCYSEDCAGIFTILLSEGFITPRDDKESVYALYDKILFDDEDEGVRRVSHIELRAFLEDFHLIEIISGSLNSERVFGCFILESNKSNLHKNIERDLIKKTFESGSEKLPYRHIIKSLLYYDEPKHLFLELYRCIERLYSLPAIGKLKERLRDCLTEKDVCSFELSEIVESSIGWRQTEESGLKMLIAKVDRSIIDAALQHIKKTSINNGVFDLEKEYEVIKNSTEDCDSKEMLISDLYTRKANIVAKIIYKTRNSFVHFREVHVTPYAQEEDIPELCNLLLLLIDPIYSEVIS